MRKYHHYGIPTKEKRKDETLVQVEGFKFYSTPFEANKWHIQWHRFPEGHGLPELVTQVPHIAFEELLSKERRFFVHQGYWPVRIPPRPSPEGLGLRRGMVQVDDLDEEIKGAKVLFGPYTPLEGYRVAMIEEQGVPIELVETKLTDQELAEIERKKLGKVY